MSTSELSYRACCANVPPAHALLMQQNWAVGHFSWVCCNSAALPLLTPSATTAHNAKWSFQKQLFNVCVKKKKKKKIVIRILNKLFSFSFSRVVWPIGKGSQNWFRGDLWLGTPKLFLIDRCMKGRKAINRCLENSPWVMFLYYSDLCSCYYEKQVLWSVITTQSHARWARSKV